jgi:Membrane-bound metallopeptidase
VVEPGDTLYSIAFRNNLDYHDLARWNGIGSDYTIYAGQRLRLTPPPGGTARPAGSSPGVSTAPSPSPPPPSPPITVTSGSPPPAATAEGNAQGWRWPTDGSVVRGFDPDHGSKGIDITGSLGQSVVAAAAGKVVYSGSALKGYGKLIIIKHHGDYLSAYGYNRELLVHEGDYVKAGDPIATMGEGPSRRTELHFEIRYKGRPVDPLGLLPRR